MWCPRPVASAANTRPNLPPAPNTTILAIATPPVLSPYPENHPQE
jgi:hypothetical protein